MKIFLIIAAAAFALFGVGAIIGAESAIHEILGVLLIGFAALMLGSVGIIAAIETAGEKITARMETLR